MGVSFVIPAFNEEEQIGGCIRSINYAMKHGTSYEVIVVDNGSTDKTEEVALSFPGVRVLKESRKGPSFARNKGWYEARFEWVAFLDADNRVDCSWAGYTELLWPDSVAAFSGPLTYGKFSFFTKVFYDIAEFAHRFIGPFTTGGNLVVRRSVLDNIGGFNENIEFYGDDTAIARRISRYGKVLFIRGMKVITSDRRLRGEGCIRTVWKYAVNYLWVTLFDKPFTNTYKDYR